MTLWLTLASPASHQCVAFGTLTDIGAHPVDTTTFLTVRRPLTLINICVEKERGKWEWTKVKAWSAANVLNQRSGWYPCLHSGCPPACVCILCSTDSGKSRLCWCSVRKRTVCHLCIRQCLFKNILVYINFVHFLGGHYFAIFSVLALLTNAAFAVRSWYEALLAKTTISTSQVLTVTVGTDAVLLTLINVWSKTNKVMKSNTCCYSNNYILVSRSWSTKILMKYY